MRSKAKTWEMEILLKSEPLFEFSSSLNEKLKVEETDKGIEEYSGITFKS